MLSRAPKRQRPLRIQGCAMFGYALAMFGKHTMAPSVCFCSFKACISPVVMWCAPPTPRLRVGRRSCNRITEAIEDEEH